MPAIFHIADPEAWAAAAPTGSYRHPSLDAEGFIHLSGRDQVVATTARHYGDVDELVLLEVDVDALERLAPGALRWEASTGGDDYPHLYAELPVAAVTRTLDWNGAARRRPPGDAGA